MRVRSVEVIATAQNVNWTVILPFSWRSRLCLVLYCRRSETFKFWNGQWSAAQCAFITKEWQLHTHWVTSQSTSRLHLLIGTPTAYCRQIVFQFRSRNHSFGRFTQLFYVECCDSILQRVTAIYTCPQIHCTSPSRWALWLLLTKRR